MIITSILIISLAINFGANQVVEKSLLTTYEKNLKNLSHSNYHYLDTLHIGAWHIENGTLYKGDYSAADMNAELDVMLSDMNIVAIIFLYDTRIATNVKANNERAVGTKASE